MKTAMLTAFGLLAWDYTPGKWHLVARLNIKAQNTAVCGRKERTDLDFRP